MSVVVSHPTGNANLRAVLRGFSRKSILNSFHTTLALPHGTWMEKLVGKNADLRLSQRRFQEIPWEKTRLHPFRELVRLTARRCGLNSLIRHESGWASVDAVYTALDTAVAKSLQEDSSSIRAVYAYEDGALKTFRTAQNLGITCLYDLPIAHWRTLRRLLKEEAECLPEWAATMGGLRDSANKLARKDEEILLADHIVVPSSFVKKSLTEHFGTGINVSVVPFGCPPPLVQHPSVRIPGEPLELMYAGHLSQRKGLAYLISALRKLEIDWRLTLAGSRPEKAPKALDDFLSDQRCHWLGVVPHSTLLKAMTKAHLFVFPSIVEGFALVTTEALAAGLPVITTPNSGADIIINDINGFVVPIQDPDTIAERITHLAENETLRAQMALNALETAARSSWEAYETSISDLAQEWITEE